MQAVLSVFPLPGDRARTGVEQRPKMLEAKTFGAGERSIEFSAARPKTLAAEGVGRRRRKMLPAGREAFPDLNVRYVPAGGKGIHRRRSGTVGPRPATTWAIARRLIDAP